MESRLRFTLLDAVRIAVALAILASIIGQLVLSISVWSDRGDPSIALNIWNFFSFFTIESNVLATACLIALVAIRAAGRKVGRWLHVGMLCVTTYMVITGIVYNVLLRGIELPQGATLGWSNEILHLVAPVWMLIDWIVTARERNVGMRDIWIVAVFPLAWLSYTLIRGPLTLDQATGADQWYPYPFLYPSNYENGYVGLAVTCLLIGLTIVAVAAILTLIARVRRGATSAPQAI